MAGVTGAADFPIVRCGEATRAITTDGTRTSPGALLHGRADIYATGCVAYWLLTGQLVFTADTPMALLLHHAQTPPTPPSARTELPIPSALDDVVLSCLAKDPTARPQTARELSRRLANVDVANAWTEDRARDWWASHEPVAS